MDFKFSFQDIQDIAPIIPLPEFHFFPQLPTKLRLKIWRLARPPARVIHADIKTECEFRVPGDVFLDHFHLAIMGHKAPPVLHVCRKSRVIFLPTYTSGFNITRDLLRFQHRPRNGRRTGRRGECTCQKYAISNTFFSCHHEALVSNKKSMVYWDPESDIVLLCADHLVLDENKFLAETAFLCSCHGWTAPKIQGVKKLAVEFDYFKHRVLGMLPEDPTFDEAKIVYVILTRRRLDGDAEWERHLTKFMCWYQQVRTNHPRGFVEERKFDWEVR